MSGWEILRDAYGYAVLSAIIAFFLQSRVPFYLGAFIFLTDGERIESALATIGIRFEPGAIGLEIVKGFVSLFGWFALLVSLRDFVPGWLAAWMASGRTVLVSHGRHCPCIRHRRSARDTRDAARIAMARI